MCMHEAQAALSNSDLYPPLFFLALSACQRLHGHAGLEAGKSQGELKKKKTRTEASVVVVIAGWKNTIKESESARY